MLTSRPALTRDWTAASPIFQLISTKLNCLKIACSNIVHHSRTVSFFKQEIYSLFYVDCKHKTNLRVKQFYVGWNQRYNQNLTPVLEKIMDESNRIKSVIVTKWTSFFLCQMKDKITEPNQQLGNSITESWIGDEKSMLLSSPQKNSKSISFFH